MKHPSSEDWASYLYEEITPEQKQEWTAHLNECQSCREEFQKWEQAQTKLNQWTLPPSTKHVQQRTPFPRWAIAAIALIGVSFLFGYLSGMRSLPAEDLVAEIREEMQREMFLAKEEFEEAVSKQREENSLEVKALRAHLENLVLTQSIKTETAIAGIQNHSSAAAKRIQMELETVALVAEGRYQLSQNHLSALGFPAPPSSPFFSIQPINH